MHLHRGVCGPCWVGRCQPTPTYVDAMVVIPSCARTVVGIDCSMGVGETKVGTMSGDSRAVLCNAGNKQATNGLLCTWLGYGVL